MPRAFLIKKKRADARAAAAASETDRPQTPHVEENTEGRSLEKERAGEKEERRDEETEVEYSSEEESRSGSRLKELSRESQSGRSQTVPSPDFHQQHPTDLSMRTASPRHSSPLRQHSPPSRPSEPLMSSSPTSFRADTPASQPSGQSPRPSPRPSPHRHFQQQQQRPPSPACGSPASHQQQQPSPPQVPAPTKRPSDFSTAFLLSRPSDNKRSRSPKQVSPGFVPYEHMRSSPISSRTEERPSVRERKQVEHENIPTLPPPAKYSPPCLSVSSWLETQASVALPASSDVSARMDCRTSGSLSPEVSRHSPERDFRSRVSLRHDDGFSAFRRSSGGSERTTRHSPSSEHRSRSGMAEMTPRELPSPHERRIPSPVARNTALTSSPEKFLTSRLLPPATLSLSNLGELRRGTSTSPAHSERTSSGSGSPAASPDSSPTQLPRYPGDFPWGQASTAAPFLHPSLPHPSQHPLLPMGLRYLPGLPLPNLSKPLPDLALPLGYPKSLSDGLASAFRSTRPPFIHPAAAAYYSSLRNSMPYPFAFSPPGGDGPCKSVGEEHQPPQGVERLEMLKALHKSSLDPMAAFQPPVPHSAAPTSIQAGHGVNTAAILSPRSVSSSSSSPMTQSSPVRPSEVSDLPPRVGLSAGLGVPGVTVGLEGRIGVGVVKRAKEHEPVRYQCEACSKSYSTFSGLSKHKQFHCAAQVKKEFSCKYCDKTYVSLGALKMHIRTHTLPCKCTVCGKAFSRPWLLQGHVRTHTGEKPFTCPHCARAFADRSNLRAHLQTHSDVKKYSCRACSKTFSRMSLLLKHEDGCCPSMV